MTIGFGLWTKRGYTCFLIGEQWIWYKKKEPTKVFYYFGPFTFQRQRYQSWIFTFGYNRKEYVKVYAEDHEKARVKMYQLYGDDWAFQYGNEEEAGVKKYGLKLLHTMGG